MENSLTVSVAVCNPDIQLLRGMLNSLILYTPEMKQLIMIDNHSQNEFAIKQIISECGFPVEYIRNESNLGFGKAHNLAVKKATGKYFAVLNDDIEFYEIWADKMIAKLQEDDKVAQVGMRTDACCMLSMTGEGGPGNSDNPDYCEGSCFIMPTGLALQYGPFDEIYQLAYMEDSDLSLRLKRDGYKITNIASNWKHYRAVTSKNIKVDLEGLKVYNNYLFRQRWNSYLCAKKFGKMIVLKRTGSIGDVFLVTPVAAALKEQDPECVICVITQTPQAIIGSKVIDFVISEVGTPFPCELFIDLDDVYEIDFRKHIIDAYADAAGVKVQRKRGILPNISNKDIQFVAKLLPDRPYMVLDLSTTWGAKQWSKKNYQQLIEKIKAESDIPIIGVGKTQEYEQVTCDINLVNILSIHQTMEVIKNASMFIGHVGLLSHIAQAADIKNVILFGCELPAFASDLSMQGYGPVLSPAACRGCRNRFNSGRKVICPRNYACMEMITPDMVYKRIQLCG